MKRSYQCWQVGGFIFTSVLGTFLHFLFDLTGGNLAAALISAVNESIWEHMKLIYYPMVLYSLLEWYFIGRNSEYYWCNKLIGLLLALILIPVLYYTYTGILGRSADWFNITIFFIAAGVAYWAEYRLFSRDAPCSLGSGPSIALILAIGLLFTVFTFSPPEIPLFQDPVTGSFGYKTEAAIDAASAVAIIYFLPTR